jgi:hypothetical protein
MAERHGAKFRVLLGGTAGKGEAAKAFPVLAEIKAYPTTLLVTREGALFALHEGFSGPGDRRSLRGRTRGFREAHRGPARLARRRARTRPGRCCSRTPSATRARACS